MQGRQLKKRGKGKGTVRWARMTTAYICTPGQEMHAAQLKQQGTALRFLKIITFIRPAYIAGKSRGAFRHMAALAT